MSSLVSDPVGLTWAEILREAALTLRNAGIDDAMREARMLLTHSQNVSTERVSLILPDHPEEADIDRFLELVTRRRAREPMSHILGHRAFYGREFIVTPHVLDPRPETEHLIDAALDGAFRNVLDLGTGSGCILLTILAERPMVRGVGADISTDALTVAARNAVALGVKSRCTLTQSDWFDVVSGRFDLIVSNPPYISSDEMKDLAPEVVGHEPHLALTPGGDGLDAYRRIAKSVRSHLNPAGRLIVEIGSTQGEAVGELMEKAGLSNIRVLKDLNGRDRVVVGDNAQ